MAIASTDLKYRLSGGAANTDPLASLGGAKSSTDAPAGYFDNVTSGEAATGDVEYRCVYFHNAHASLTALAVKLWISANTPSGDTGVEIGLGTSAVGANEQTVADESTAPAGVTFSAPANEGAALVIGDVPAGQHKAFWVKRTVSAAAASTADSFTVRAKCDTLP